VFKSYVAQLSNRAEFRALKITIMSEDITEVVSHDHVILQCLDIVLGAMNFRLNDKHLAKPPGEKRRSPKTRAREKLYKYINKRIRKIYPYFNVASLLAMEATDQVDGTIPTATGALLRGTRSFFLAVKKRRGPHSPYINLPSRNLGLRGVQGPQ
jgi:hypothetical protein